MTCPNCKLLNPSTATRCDCGYDFQDRTMRESHVAQGVVEERKPNMVVVTIGVILIVLTFISTPFTPPRRPATSSPDDSLAAKAGRLTGMLFPYLLGLGLIFYGARTRVSRKSTDR